MSGTLQPQSHSPAAGLRSRPKMFSLTSKLVPSARCSHAALPCHLVPVQAWGLGTHDLRLVTNTSTASQPIKWNTPSFISQKCLSSLAGLGNLSLTCLPFVYACPPFAPACVPLRLSGLLSRRIGPRANDSPLSLRNNQGIGMRSTAFECSPAMSIRAILSSCKDCELHNLGECFSCSVQREKLPRELYSSEVPHW